MKTGEGKTLVASLPLYLNALKGKGAHLVTVNDYLARRDAGWMGPLFHRLGLSVGVIAHETSVLYDPDYLDETHSDSRLQHFRPVSRTEAYRDDDALQAEALDLRAHDCRVKDAKAVIVDEFTGRLMPGRRWSAGVHQAVEAKEGLQVAQEQKTGATIALQTYFRLFEKLA